MQHVDLFSGIGGFSLACDWLGIPTICFCEMDKFCQKVLEKHWPGVPIVEDVNNVEEIKRIVRTFRNSESDAGNSQRGFPQRKNSIARGSNPDDKSGDTTSYSELCGCVHGQTEIEPAEGRQQALGNAIVPQVAYEIIKSMLENQPPKTSAPFSLASSQENE